jgi:hypothetical protein
MKDSVDLLNSTAEALDELVGPVGKVNVDYPVMAWLFFVARELPDTEARFPHGKWGTLQHIEAQLIELARIQAAEVRE